MKLEKFKERDNKRIGIIVFTIVCILLVSGVILYRTFAIFEVNTTQNIINGKVGSMGDLEFVFYKDDVITKTVPEEDGYAFDSSESYCLDRSTGSQVSNVSWNKNAKSIELNDMAESGKVKCYLHFNKIYQESELHGAIPDLGNGRLIPITLNETGQAVKADIMNTDTPWYSYVDKKWANAVILRDGIKDTYEPGTLIKEEDIESYFVWIPRFEYQIWNGQAETNEFTGIKEDLKTIENSTENDQLNQAKEIQINFVTKEEPIKYGMNTGDWLTHPAFTSFDVNGIWVGKFETSKSENEDYDSISPESVQIKPGVSSWRNIRVANAFYTTYNYKRELDSHMMKNMEWGAVAYLTNSKYGRCSGEKCEEVRINNNSDYITGSSAVNQPTCGFTNTNISCHEYGASISIVNSYSNPDSVASSTTNNYYGIFDMAGGAWEYVMGVMLDENGKPASGRHNVYNSGFVGTLTCPTCTDTNVIPDKDKTTWTADDKDKGLAWPDSRYYDTYGYKPSSQYYERGHLGDGTAEFGPFYSVQYKTGNEDATMTRQVSGWNADDAFFVYYAHPWFRRGGHYADGTDAGTSAFSYTYGHANGSNSFRVVLTP